MIFYSEKAIVTLLVALLLVAYASCSHHDDEVDVPIESNPQVEKMLNSAEVTKLDCVSAILKGEMVSQSDLQRFYPQKFVMLSIMFMDADESVQMENVDDFFFKKQH